MSAPLVSVVVPAYNCGPYIGQALDSILGQGYRSLEVLVVDDGSSDGTADAVAAFGEPVKLLRQCNGGPAAARNHGVRESRGEYLAFLDGDDLWLPGKLQLQLAHMLRNTEVAVVHTRFSRWYPDADGRFCDPGVAPPDPQCRALEAQGSGWIYPELLLDCAVHIITALMRRPLFDELGGFDESLRTGEDYDFWIRASRRAMMHKLAVVSALYRMHPTSTTTRPRATSNEYTVLRRALERFGERGPDGRAVDRDALDRRLAEVCFQHAHLHYWRGDPCVAARSFQDALKYRRRDWRTIAYAALSRLRCAVAAGEASGVE